MTRKKTLEEVRKEVTELGFELVSTEYINSKTPIEIKCEIHGDVPILIGNLRLRKECPKCAVDRKHENKRHNPKDIKEMINESGYKLHEIIDVGECKPKRLVVSCNEGHEKYNVTYQNFKKGRRCPHCKADKNRNNIEDIKNEMLSEGFTLVSGNYISNQSELIVTCKKNHEYTTTYSLFQSGKRCPVCCESKGEVLLRNYLTELNVDFTPQYTLQLDSKRLYVDFCVHTNFGDLFIEYDGIQHFKPVQAFGGEEGFRKQQVNDKLKNEYARDNDIGILRVRYNQSPDEVKKEVLTFLQDNDTITSTNIRR